MFQLKILEVLVFYDVPQVFTAMDIFGTKYLCMLYSCDDEYHKYLAVKISETRLDLFKGGIIDLLSIYNKPEAPGFFDVSVYANEEIMATEIDYAMVNQDMLPEPGFYCKYEAVVDDKLISESIEKGKLVSCIAFSDTRNSHDIDVNVLTQALTYYQSMVRNCHVKRFGNSSSYETNMKAYAIQAASFDVHIELNERLNMFGESPKVSSTLQLIDNIFLNNSDEGWEDRVCELKGHTLTSMRSFLKILQENQLTFKHKWVKSTLEQSVSVSTVSLDMISRVYDYLNKHNDLDELEVEFEGYFASGTVLEKGKWVFVADGKKISGTTSEANIFNGITLGDHYEYKIKCIEYHEVNTVNAKIRERYKLVECTILN